MGCCSIVNIYEFMFILILVKFNDGKKKGMIRLYICGNLLLMILYCIEKKNDVRREVKFE